jgi:hypothetical protein
MVEWEREKFKCQYWFALFKGELWPGETGFKTRSSYHLDKEIIKEDIYSKSSMIHLNYILCLFHLELKLNTAFFSFFKIVCVPVCSYLYFVMFCFVWGPNDEKSFELLFWLSQWMMKYTQMRLNHHCSMLAMCWIHVHFPWTSADICDRFYFMNIKLYP